MSAALGDDPLIRLSYEELRDILDWASTRGARGAPVILVGGWAVEEPHLRAIGEAVRTGLPGLAAVALSILPFLIRRPGPRTPV